MISTISKQGGRRYGQIRSTTTSAVWFPSIKSSTSSAGSIKITGLVTCSPALTGVVTVRPSVNGNLQ